MNYDHTPRPEIENHYHIKELIERQEKRFEDKEYHRNVEKARDERKKDIEAAKNVEVKPFWCVTCHKDFVSVTYKQIDNWGDSACYKTKHKPCGSWCMRLITDSWRDAYWTNSKLLAKDRRDHYNDMVQPHMTGFNTLYGKK